MRTPGALRVPGHPQHPPVLRHQEGREKEAEAHGQQGQGRAGGARQEVKNKIRILILINSSKSQWKSGQQAAERRLQHHHDADRCDRGVPVGGDAAHGDHRAPHHLVKVGEIIRLGGGNKLATAVNFQRYGLS